MAEQDFKFDDALLMKTAREMLAKKLTETVKRSRQVRGMGDNRHRAGRI